jgi:hypothetical protein
MFSRWWILVVTACKLKSSSSYERIIKKTGDSVLVQSKGTYTIYFNSIRIITYLDVKFVYETDEHVKFEANLNDKIEV